MKVLLFGLSEAKTIRKIRQKTESWSPLAERSWSGRSPESIVEEFAQIKAPLVAFTDEIRTHDVDRVERICDLVLDRGIRKKYIVNARLEIARR